MKFTSQILQLGFCIQTIFTTTIETIICFIRIILESSLKTSFPLCKSPVVYVLGNGPSLSTDIRKLPSREGSDVSIFCVNDFYKSEDFEVIKPDYYVIADPSYWNDLLYDEVSNPLVEKLSNVSWDIVLFIPVTAQGSLLDSNLKNAGVRFLFFNKTPLGGWQYICSIFFRFRLAMPKPQNVLTAAIAIAIWIGYKEINLIGADHDWHKDIHVSEQNILLTRNRHSYYENDSFRPFYKPSTKLMGENRNTFSVAEIFHAWAMVHRSYEQLEEISNDYGVEILNRGTSSFVDAFKRKNLF